MKRQIFISIIVLMFAPILWAQESGKTLASTLEVYVFPSDGQEAGQQSKDESECYGWATTNTGSDPFDLQKQSVEQEQETQEQVAQAQQSTQGAGARGALRGAAAGALIGEVSGGDAGDSAAIGAAVGAVHARRRGRAASSQAQEQATQQGESQQQATADQVDNFKKAFSVCLEAKEYLVKY